MSDNLKIWSALEKTDPAHTKKFQRAGGFKGTSVKPIYCDRKMTEQFGPCGIGWGMNEPRFEVVHLGDEVAVYCTVGLWHGEKQNLVYGVGGDFVAKNNKNGLFADDEAFKKAYTDALGNAMKHIGMAADIHMGQHDDDKYVTELRRELNGDPVKAAISAAVTSDAPKAKKDPLAPWKGPLSNSELTKRLRVLTSDLALCEDMNMLNACLSGYQGVIEQLRIDVPEWWNGEPDGNGFIPLKQRIEDREALLSHSPQPHELLATG